MNKLAVLAFTLLLFFSAMSWFLASGSLNDYLKSQASLQGEYYSGQKTQLNNASFDSNTGIANFEQLTLANLDNYKNKYALKVSHVAVQLLPQAQANLLTIEQITIDKLEVFIEQQGNQNNLAQLQNKIVNQLVADYPKYYPALSAKQFALAHPELNAQHATEQISADKRQETAAAIAAKQAKKNAPKRGKKTNDIQLLSIIIKELVINRYIDGEQSSVRFTNLTLNDLANEKPLESTQLGGELLKRIIATSLVKSQ